MPKVTYVLNEISFLGEFASELHSPRREKHYLKRCLNDNGRKKLLVQRLQVGKNSPRAGGVSVWAAVGKEETPSYNILKL